MDPESLEPEGLVNVTECFEDLDEEVVSKIHGQGVLEDRQEIAPVDLLVNRIDFVNFLGEQSAMREAAVDLGDVARQRYTIHVPQEHLYFLPVYQYLRQCRIFCLLRLQTVVVPLFVSPERPITAAFQPGPQVLVEGGQVV